MPYPFGPDERRSSFRPEHLCLAAVLGVLALHCAHYWPFISDDAYISMRYAQRFAHGLGLTYTDGERVEGYTNLLWVLLLALGNLVGLSPLLAGRVFGFLATAGTIWLVSLSAKQPTRPSVSRLLTGGLLFALSAPAAVWAIGGLEQALLFFLLMLFLFFFREWTKDIESARAAKRTGAALALIALTRADGIVLVAAGLALSAWVAWRRWTTLRRVALPPAMAVAGQLLFRLAYYHDYVPNTARAKVALTIGRIVDGYHHVSAAFPGFAIVLLLASAAVALRPRARVTAAAALLFAAWTAHLTIVGGDIFPAWRLAAIAYVPLYFLIAETAERFARGRQRAWLLLPLAVAAALHLDFQQSDPQNRRGKDERWELESEPVGLMLKQAFGAKKPLLAVDAAGGLPYWSELPTLDMLGLADAFLARNRPADFGSGQLGHELGNGQYLWGRKPDLIAFCSGKGEGAPCFRGGQELVAIAGFASFYKPIAFAPGGRAPRGQIFVRFRDGKLGIEAGRDEIRVPGFLLGDSQGAHVRLAADGTPLAQIEPGMPGSLSHVPIPAGTWELSLATEGAPAVASFLCPGDGAYTSLVARNGARFMLTAPAEVAVVVGTGGTGPSRVHELRLRRAQTAASGPAICQKPANQPIRIAAANLGTRRPAGAHWAEPPNFVFDKAGILIELGTAWRSPALELSLDNNDKYRIGVARGDKVVYAAEVGPTAGGSGLVPYTVHLPAAIAAAGYDRVLVLPLEGDGAYSLGHVLPSDVR